MKGRIKCTIGLACAKRQSGQEAPRDGSRFGSAPLRLTALRMGSSRFGLHGHGFKGSRPIDCQGWLESLWHVLRSLALYDHQAPYTTYLQVCQCSAPRTSHLIINPSCRPRATDSSVPLDPTYRERNVVNACWVEASSGYIPDQI